MSTPVSSVPRMYGNTFGRELDFRIAYLTEESYLEQNYHTQESFVFKNNQACILHNHPDSAVMTRLFCRAVGNGELNKAGRHIKALEACSSYIISDFSVSRVDDVQGCSMVCKKHVKDDSDLKNMFLGLYQQALLRTYLPEAAAERAEETVYAAAAVVAPRDQEDQSDLLATQ